MEALSRRGDDGGLELHGGVAMGLAGGGGCEPDRGRWGRAKLGLGTGDAGVAYRRRGGRGWPPRMSLAPWMAATPLHRPCSEGKGISGSGLVLYSGGSASWAVWPSWPGRPFSLFLYCIFLLFLSFLFSFIFSFCKNTKVAPKIDVTIYTTATNNLALK